MLNRDQSASDGRGIVRREQHQRAGNIGGVAQPRRGRARTHAPALSRLSPEDTPVTNATFSPSIAPSIQASSAGRVDGAGARVHNLVCDLARAGQPEKGDDRGDVFEFGDPPQQVRER
jgi:hypothetical protein